MPDNHNRVPARISRRTYFGDVYYYDVEIGLDEPLEVKEENRPELSVLDVGAEVTVSWLPAAANLVVD